MPREAGAGVVRRELLGHGALYTVASALQAMSVLLVLPVATRLLSPDDFGTVTTAIVILQFLGLAAAWGLPSVVMLEYLSHEQADGPERARRLVTTTAVFAAGLVLVVDLAGHQWSRLFGGAAYGADLRLAVWGAVPLATIAAAQSILRSARRPVAFVSIAAAGTLGAQLVAVGAVWVVGGGATAYLVGLVAGTTATAVAAVALVGPRRPTFAPAVLRSALHTSLPLVPHSLALFALLAADRIVIERELGASATGRYQIAYLIGAGVLSLLAAVNNAWSPIVLGAPEPDRWRILAATTRDLERVIPLLVGTVGLLAPFILMIAAPAAYEPIDLLPVTVVVSVTALPYLWYLSGVHVVLSRRRTVILAVATPTVALVAVTANLLLLDTFGVIAAAVVTVGSYALLAVVVRRSARRIADVPWDLVMSMRTAAWTLAIAALALLLPVEGPWSLARVVAVVAIGVPAARHWLPGLRTPATALA